MIKIGWFSKKVKHLKSVLDSGFQGECLLTNLIIPVRTAGCTTMLIITVSWFSFQTQNLQSFVVLGP